MPIISIIGGSENTDAAELNPPSPTKASTIGNSHARTDNVPITIPVGPSRLTRLVKLLLVSSLIGSSPERSGETSR